MCIRDSSEGVNYVCHNNTLRQEAFYTAKSQDKKTQRIAEKYSIVVVPSHQDKTRNLTIEDKEYPLQLAHNLANRNAWLARSERQGHIKHFGREMGKAEARELFKKEIRDLTNGFEVASNGRT